MKASAIVAAVFVASSLNVSGAEEPETQQSQIEHLNACLAESNERVASLRLALQAPKVDPNKITVLEDALLKVTRQKSEFEEQLAAKDRQLESSLADNEKALAELQAENSEKSSTLATLNQKLAEKTVQLETANHVLLEKESTIKDSDGLLSQAQSALKKAQEAFRKAEAEKLDREASLQEQLVAVENAQGEATTWKTQFAKLEASFEQERQKSADREKLQTELTTLRAKQAEDAKRLEALELEHASQQQTLTTTQQEASVVQQRLAAVQSELETERKNAANTAQLRQDLQAIKEQRENDAERLAILQNEREAQTQALANTKNINSSVEQRLTDFEKQLFAKNQELAKAQQSIAQWKQQFSSLEEKEQAAQQERIQILAMKTQLEQDLASTKQTSLQLQQQLLRIDPIRYELNSAAIDREQERVRDQVRTILAIFPKARFEISGHTCTLGSEEQNQSLSEQRAKRLLDFLVADGVAAEQLSALGYGETRPVSSNDTDAGRRKNRRVEINVLSADGKVLLDTEAESDLQTTPGN